MDKKIDIVIITGFLGAGKTTLLNKLVTSYSDQKIGLLVNDFGKVPIDGSIVRNNSTDPKNKIYEIGNGSIFCSCLTADFVMGLQFFIKEAPDILFIETSGMSDPSSMARLLGEYKLWDAFNIKHVLCVSDCTNVLKLRKHMTFVDRQIESSNTILLNKCDLVTEEIRNEITTVMARTNSTARLEFTNYCEFDYKSMDSKEFMPDGAATSCNTKSNRPSSLNLPQLDLPKDEFIKYLNSIIPTTLRIKGFYSFGTDHYYISNNNGVIELEEITEEKKQDTGITIILIATYMEELESSWDNFKKDHTV
ncbi:MAG: GTP-binding protein [Spirochaetaceae bacterium]